MPRFSCRRRCARDRPDAGDPPRGTSLIHCSAKGGSSVNAQHRTIQHRTSMFGGRPLNVRSTAPHTAMVGARPSLASPFDLFHHEGPNRIRGHERRWPLLANGKRQRGRRSLVIRYRRRSRPPEPKESVDDYGDDNGGRLCRLGPGAIFLPECRRRKSGSLPAMFCYAKRDLAS